MTIEKNVITCYFAVDTPVSLSQAFDSPQKFLPDGFSEMWLDKVGDNGLLMELELINKKKPKENYNIICTDLKKESLQVDFSKYEIH